MPRIKNDIGAILNEQMAFDDAVGKMLAMTEGRDDILFVLTSDHGNANPGLNGTGAGYRQTNEHFSRIARIKGSAEWFLQQWGKTKTKSAAEMSKLMEATYGFKPSPRELEAVMDRAAGKKVAVVEQSTLQPGRPSGADCRQRYWSRLDRHLPHLRSDADDLHRTGGRELRRLGEKRFDSRSPARPHVGLGRGTALH